MKITETQSISIEAYAKINLCLDVLGKLPGGFHEVAMVMQQIGLHDVVRVRWTEDPKHSELEIELSTDAPDLTNDEENLAYRAAREMIKEHAGDRRGVIVIDIEKNIPLAAGLAGGSSDCAAVIHALNHLWELGLDIRTLCEIGSRLGSDVPFCIMGQAAADPTLRIAFAGDGYASHCAIARGRGTDLEPIPGLKSFIVLSKPAISVSTREVYQGIDEEVIPIRPDIEEMRLALTEKKGERIEKNMVNVLENFTLKRYPLVVYTKNKMQGMCKTPPLMSGSGPTVFCLCRTEEEAVTICRAMKAVNEESYWMESTY